MFLLAVHITDGVLAPSWWLTGTVLALALAVVGAWRIRDEEIPRMALVTAVFFVASQIHVALGVSTAHLLLNGLVGVVLGRRALLAIPIGLFLQAALFGHGGFSSLGVNSCVMSIPAILAFAVYRLLCKISWTTRPATRFLLVVTSVFVWAASLLGGILLLGRWRLQELPAGIIVGCIGGLLIIALLAAWWERKLETAPEFPIGLCVGVLAVLGALGLHCFALIYGGALPPVNRAIELEAARLGVHSASADVPVESRSTELPTTHGWRLLALVVLIVHMPIAAVEGLILGFLVGFLARVKPELIGWPREDKLECAIHPAG